MMEGRRAFNESWHKLKWLLLVLALLLIYNFLASPGFFHIELKDGRLYGTLIDIGKRGTPVMLLSIGMALVIATGGVDLSVGAVMAISGALAARLVIGSRAGEMLGTTALAYPFLVVFLLAVAAGTAAGLWNGILVSFLRVQPIVATLILMVAGRGFAQLITGGQIITFENPSFAYLSGGHFLGLPFGYTITAIAFLATALLIRKTALGLFIEATGDNEKASSISGINTRFIKCFAYATSGLFAAVAGLIAASDIKAADANNAGIYLELDAILAVVIGGTSLTGGRFYLFNSLIGAILIQALTTTILTRGVPVEYTLVVKAVLILAVCLVQSETFRQTFTAPSKRSPA
jgi:galactofuranose transport system permease protein